VKVVFLEDVPNVGEVGEVKEVADGYGRHFLIPRKLAVLANSMASNIVEVQLKKKARRQAEIQAEMRDLADQLEGKEIILKARAGAKEQLYGSITSADIADELCSSAGLIVDKRKIELDEPIRQLGSYAVAIRLTKDIIPKVKLVVVAEEEKEEKKEEGKKTKAGKKGEEIEAKVAEDEGKEAETEKKEVKKEAGKKKTKAGKKGEEIEAKVAEDEGKEEETEKKEVKKEAGKKKTKAEKKGEEIEAKIVEDEGQEAEKEKKEGETEEA